MNRVITVRHGPKRAVVLAGIRGPKGPVIADVEVDADGYLIVTMDDDTVIRSAEPVNRPWGTIAGDIENQTDLMELLGDLEDSIPATPEDIGAVADDDPRLTDARTPTGGAGGVLSGSYPNPEFAVDMATQAELESGLAGKVDKVTGKGLSTEDYTTAEKAKLGGIAAGATANATDAQLRDRATHTGSQAISTVTGLQAALNLKLDATATAADSSKLGGQLPAYYATAAQVGDIATALDLINGEVI